MASMWFWMHESASAVEALFAFGEGDWDGFGAAIRKSGDGGRESVRRVRLCGEIEGGVAAAATGEGQEKAAAIEDCPAHGCHDCRG